MKSIIKDALILCLITVIAGGCLGLVYEITKEPIATQQEEAKNKAYKEVFKTADDKYLAEKFEAVEGLDLAKVADAVAAAGIEKDEITDIAAAKDGNGLVVGYVFNVTAKDGYGGNIQFTVGILNDGTVNNISLLSISETAGLGMKAKEDSFQAQYRGKNVDSFTVVKDGTGATNPDRIDALSGATITSKAVTKGVNSAIAAFKFITGK
ncbi:MAG: RnfABCDGE type electron transport complex subunit G [Lachnospiraceae bacterium]